MKHTKNSPARELPSLDLEDLESASGGCNFSQFLGGSQQLQGGSFDLGSLGSLGSNGSLDQLKQLFGGFGFDFGNGGSGLGWRDRF